MIDDLSQLWGKSGYRYFSRWNALINDVRAPYSICVGSQNDHDTASEGPLSNVSNCSQSPMDYPSSASSCTAFPCRRLHPTLSLPTTENPRTKESRVDQPPKTMQHLSEVHYLLFANWNIDDVMLIGSSVLGLVWQVATYPPKLTSRSRRNCKYGSPTFWRRILYSRCQRQWHDLLLRL